MPDYDKKEQYENFITMVCNVGGKIWNATHLRQKTGL